MDDGLSGDLNVGSISGINGDGVGDGFIRNVGRGIEDYGAGWEDFLVECGKLGVEAGLEGEAIAKQECAADAA